ncbi:hypothetical protein [Pseudonocardia sp. TRM90224]|uniref:hypothetical protein n=1 Tax=Pseudonocardia sp. TRM90224 TaxID=2812678 RepID=UPI001E5E4714|nr:hypothetical protein [Pseudonocardia sp. TRM90224]
MTPDFADPGPWHRPAAYWFWHRLPGRDEIRAQVAQMHDGGFHTFMIQTRLSFPIGEYLGAEFLDAYRFAVDVAAEHDMVVGIYDDYCWQSGHAAGRAVQGHDGLRERHLFWSPATIVDGRLQASVSGIRSATENLGPAAMAWHYEGAQPAWADWRVEYVLVSTGDGTHDAAGSATLVEAGVDGCTVAVEPFVATGDPDATVTVLVSARCATSRLINVLDRAAVERFVAAAYEPIAEQLAPHLGYTVAYMFFDQPHAVFYDWAQHDWAQRRGDLRSSMPFHSSLDEAIRACPDHVEMLGAVLRATDAGQLARRARFYELFSTHAMEAFLGTVSRWSHDHNLLQSGHEVLSHVGSWNVGDAFANWDLRLNFGLDHFGVDGYRDLTAVDAQDAVPQLSAKLGDGVARHHGRTGTIVEQYFMTPPPGGSPFSGHWGLTLQELRATAVRHHFQGMRQLVFHGFYLTDGHDRDHELLANPRYDFPPGVNYEPWFAEHHAAFALESARLSTFLDGVRTRPEVALLYPLRTIWTHGQVGAHAEHLGGWASALTAGRCEFDIVDERDLDSVEALLARGFDTIVLPNVETLRSRRTVEVVAALQAGGVRLVTSGRTPWIYQSGEQTAAADWAELAPVEHFTEPPERFASRRAEPGPTFPAGEPPDLWMHNGVDADGHTRIAMFNDGPDPVRAELPVPDGLHCEEWLAESGERIAHRSPNVVLEPNELRLFVLRPGAVEGAPTDVRWGPPRELRDGWMLDGTPVQVDSGWEAQGRPTFSGRATYRTTVDLDAGRDHLLTLPAVAGSVRVHVDGREIGMRGWAPYRFRIPADAVTNGPSTLQIDVASAAANHYYAGTGMRTGPEPAGLLAPPELRPAASGSDG